MRNTNEEIEKRLERELPRLLAGSTFDYSQLLSDFRHEEEQLDQEIEHVWEQVVSSAPRRQRQWGGLAAAGLLVSLGVAGVLTQIQKLEQPALRSARLEQPALCTRSYPSCVAERLEQVWQPHETVRTAKDIVLVVLVQSDEDEDGVVVSSKPVTVTIVETQQSSGSPDADRLAAQAARQELSYLPLPRSLTAQGMRLAVRFHGPDRKVTATSLP
ncbi:MAG: hypothetical protein H7Y22_10665 [Gemmatimonadaceae bacterium]|nr:hypothetical protein [Gloeobacterales cyanobacterium ES-bin-141]